MRPFIVLSILLASGCGSTPRMERALASEYAPLLGHPYGQVVTLKIVAVSKGNSYFEQNLIEANCRISVKEINGQPVWPEITANPVMAEEFDVEIGQEYVVQAYETLIPLGEPRDWDDEISQIDYRLVNWIVIRPDRPPN